MHLYRLKILLTILFIVIWSPICFNLSSFYRHIFSFSLIPSFLFFTPSKMTQNKFTTIRHLLDVLFIPFKSPYSVEIRENTDQKKLRNWTLFTQCYLHSLVYTYLHLLIHTYALFILLHEFDKIDKTWQI